MSRRWTDRDAASPETGDLVLTAEDRTALTAAVRACSSPFAYETAAAWADAMGRTVQALLGADRAMVNLDIAHGDRVFVADTAGHEAVATYMAEEFWRHDRVLADQAMAARSVYGAAQSFTEAALAHDLLHQEWSRPARLFDAVGIAAGAGAGSPIPSTIHVYRGSDVPLGTMGSARGYALARLVAPAFASGLTTWASLHAQRAMLASLVDSLPTGLVVYGSDGARLHVNEAAARIVGTVDTTASWTALARIARAALVAGGGGTEIVYCGRRAVRVHATMLAAATFASEPTVALVLARSGPRPNAWLAERGCTPREIEVAQRVASGAESSDVAATLGISVHTARRHLEAVFRKVGVRTRAELAARLTRLAAFADGTA